MNEYEKIINELEESISKVKEDILEKEDIICSLLDEFSE